MIYKTVRLSEEAHSQLIALAGYIQKKQGRRIPLNAAIAFIHDNFKSRFPDF